jgi:hypothetical protein
MIRSLQLVIRALRKIDDDLILHITSDVFTLRALNATRSALPIIDFKSSYFHSFTYKADAKQLVYQLAVSGLITAFKNVAIPTSLKIVIHQETRKFNLGLPDKYGILHDC